MNIYTSRNNRHIIAAFIYLCFTLIFSNNLFAQEYTLKPTKLLKQAKEFIRVEEYHHAEVALKDAYRLKPESIEINYYLGITYLHSFERKKSLLHFEKVINSDRDFPKLNFYTGKAYHYNHRFDEAIEYYNRFRKTIHPKKSDITEEDIDLLIEQCENGKIMVEHPVDVEIFNLGNKINSEKIEFAPVISADETTLIFTSRRPDSFGEEMDPLTNEPYEDIYVSRKDQNGEWSKPVNIGKPINTDTHDASIGLSPDGLKLFLYKDKKSNNIPSGDIYYSDFKNGEWKKPRKLQDGVNSSGLENHASITADEKILFITSDREQGSYGGMDIYMVRRLPDMSWAAPKNVGPKINTEFDEEGPFIDPEGLTLYFSSKGHKSMGGFDIFSSKLDLETGEWSDPVNLGYPINTADDDLFYVWSADGTRGYFSSSRDDSHGEQDLYMVSYPKHALSIIVLKGKVTDIETKKPLASIIEVTDNDTNEVIAVSTSNNFNGQYSLFLQPNKNYGVRVKCNGHLFKSLNLNVDNQFDFLELREDIELKPIKDKQYEELNNVFFAESTELKVESEPELKAIKEFLERDELKDYEIEVAIHSDNREDSVLSIFKTKAVADVLRQGIQNFGLASNRLVTNGYGFGSKYPIATNLTGTGRKTNNRIEYILRKKDTVYTEIDYADDLDVKIYDSKKDEVEYTCNKIDDTNLLDLEKVILFHSTDNAITSQAEVTIKEVVEAMERCPDAKLEIRGHTDNQGHESYNVKISNKRASIIAQQLAYRGIEKERLIIKAFGSAYPLASNDSIHTRRKNNRVDFKPYPADIKNINFEVEVAPLVLNDTLETITETETVLAKSDSIEVDTTEVVAKNDTIEVNNTDLIAKKDTIKKDNTDVVIAKNDEVDNKIVEKKEDVKEEKIDAPEIGKILYEYNVHFDFDSDNLSLKSKETLDNAIAYLKEHPTYKLEIGGHTDNIGSAVYNINLGKRRAASVLDYIFDQLGSERFSIKSYGLEKPFTSNDSRVNRRKNRRVELKIIGTIVKS